MTPMERNVAMTNRLKLRKIISCGRLMQNTDTLNNFYINLLWFSIGFLIIKKKFKEITLYGNLADCSICLECWKNENEFGKKYIRILSDGTMDGTEVAMQICLRMHATWRKFLKNVSWIYVQYVKSCVKCIEHHVKNIQHNWNS